MNAKRYGATTERTHVTPPHPGYTLSELVDEWESDPDSLVYQLAVALQEAQSQVQSKHNAMLMCRDQRDESQQEASRWLTQLDAVEQFIYENVPGGMCGDSVSGAAIDIMRTLLKDRADTVLAVANADRLDDERTAAVAECERLRVVVANSQRVWWSCEGCGVCTDTKPDVCSNCGESAAFREYSKAALAAQEQPKPEQSCTECKFSRPWEPPDPSVVHCEWFGCGTPMERERDCAHFKSSGEGSGCGGIETDPHEKPEPSPALREAAQGLVAWLDDRWLQRLLPPHYVSGFDENLNALRGALAAPEAESEPGKIRRNLDTPERRRLWEQADECAAEVAKWPAWKRGEPEPAPALREAVERVVSDLQRVHDSDGLTDPEREALRNLRAALAAPETEPAQSEPDWRNRPVGEVESCLRCGNCAHWQPPSGRVSGYPFCRNAQSSRCNLVTQRDESCELYALGTGKAGGKGAE